MVWRRAGREGGHGRAAKGGRPREGGGYGTRTGEFEGFPNDARWHWAAITAAELAGVRCRRSWGPGRVLAGDHPLGMLVALPTLQGWHVAISSGRG